MNKIPLIKLQIYFFKQCGIRPAVSIHIEKQIPSQAGLAGGSADAAAVLHGLNQLFQTNLTEATV